jgi:hypothetical protein
MWTGRYIVKILPSKKGRKGYERSKTYQNTSPRPLLCESILTLLSRVSNISFRAYVITLRKHSENGFLCVMNAYSYAKLAIHAES